MSTATTIRRSLVGLISLTTSWALCAEPALKTESFDRDPGWEGHNNHLVPKKVLLVKQDFGYSTTHHAGKAAGELGGTIQRSTTPAYYADKIPSTTLNDKFSASGSFAITGSQSGAGLFFGFFQSQQPGGSGRPIGSLGMDMDFESKGGRIAVRLITSGNKSCGTSITGPLPTTLWVPEAMASSRSPCTAIPTPVKTTASCLKTPKKRPRLVFPTPPHSRWI